MTSLRVSYPVSEPFVTSQMGDFQCFCTRWLTDRIEIGYCLLFVISIILGT